MNRNFLCIFGVLLFSSAALANDSIYADSELVQERNAYEEADADPKIFFGTTTTGTFVTVNATLLLLSAGIALWGIAGAVALYYLLTAPATTGGYTGYTGGTGGGYSRGRNYNSWDGSFGSGFNWDQFTILDAIAMAEDAYENFDPSDLQCQKRLICEIHQNASEFGYPAKTLVDTMSYLQYASVLSLPQEFKMLAEEYLDAADRGRNNIKECGEIYKTCKFSVKKITERLSHNEI